MKNIITLINVSDEDCRLVLYAGHLCCIREFLEEEFKESKRIQFNIEDDGRLISFGLNSFLRTIDSQELLINTFSGISDNSKQIAQTMTFALVDFSKKGGHFAATKHFCLSDFQNRKDPRKFHIPTLGIFINKKTILSINIIAKSTLSFSLAN